MKETIWSADNCQHGGVLLKRRIPEGDHPQPSIQIVPREEGWRIRDCVVGCDIAGVKVPARLEKLVQFVAEWVENVRGGDRYSDLTGWERTFVTEGRNALDGVRGAKSIDPPDTPEPRAYPSMAGYRQLKVTHETTMTEFEFESVLSAMYLAGVVMDFDSREKLIYAVMAYALLNGTFECAMWRDRERDAEKANAAFDCARTLIRLYLPDVLEPEK